MELEVIRMVAAALADATHGVSAALPGVPRDAGDAQPAAVTIYDSTRHGWVTREEITLRGLNATLPAVTVGVYKPATVDPEIQTVFRDGSFDVVLQYLTTNDDSAAASAAGLYTMRAAMRSLAWFHHPDQAATMRARNGVLIKYCSAMSPAPIAAVRGDVAVTAALLLTYAVRDTAPQFT